MRQPQGSAHLRTVFDQPYASAAKPSVTACLLAVGLIRVFLYPKPFPGDRPILKNIGTIQINIGFLI